jgi:LCP family protein required for cell wall assembly
MMERLRALLTRTGRTRQVLMGGSGVIVVVVIAVLLTLGRPPGETAVISPTPPPPTATLAATPSATPSPTSSPAASETPVPTADPLLGTDGRFTILLLGSDYRPAHPGNRTDTIMVVSIDPTTGQTAVVSIPRDTAKFPLPNGTTYAPKLNALYQQLVSADGQAKAGRAIKAAIGGALGVEVDYYALIGFEGVRRLVDAIGGVDVVLDHAVSDPYYWVTARQQGVYFPAGTNHLNGARALIFARTRKGDNDYERARRQQLLVAATVAKVRASGPAVLADLVKIGSSLVRTDLPLAQVAEIAAIVKMADVNTTQRVVFGPRTYADGVAGTTDLVLKMDVVRSVIARWMPPIPGSPANPQAASPAPSPSP